MPQRPFTSQLSAAGLALTGAGAVAAEAAWLHMRTVASQVGIICGSTQCPHCGLCAVSATALLAGLACLALSTPSPRLARA